jgi:hypothetical protein
MAWERLLARGFVIAGGLFWIVAAFAAWYGFREASFVESVGGALNPFLLTVVTFVIGWRYERLASVLLAVGAVGILAWGILSAWSSGLWTIMVATLLAPIVIASVLFYLASRMEKVCAVPGAGDRTTAAGHAV